MPLIIIMFEDLFLVIPVAIFSIRIYYDFYGNGCLVFCDGQFFKSEQQNNDID